MVIAGRLCLRGTWVRYYEIDTARSKEMAITEAPGLKFRAEAFNPLKHPIYGDRACHISSSGLGVIIAPLNAGASRIGTPGACNSCCA